MSVFTESNAKAAYNKCLGMSNYNLKYNCIFAVCFVEFVVYCIVLIINELIVII